VGGGISALPNTLSQMTFFIWDTSGTAKTLTTPTSYTTVLDVLDKIKETPYEKKLEKKFVLSL
jgi:hypothetical protein